LYGFEHINGMLVSEHNDPNLTYRQIDQPVRYISVQCSNLNPEALSQVFWRRENHDFNEDNSITLPLSGRVSKIKLPRTIKVTSLRFDLTNQPDDRLVCQGVTINPKVPFNMSFVRLILLLISIFGLIFGPKIIPEKFSNAFLGLLINNGIWGFFLLIILIDLTYPVTLTYDSAHYLWLANLIGPGNWASWDPIRNIIFPLHNYLTLSIFGLNQQALLYPMILAHILLFFFSCQIVFDVFKGKDRFLISLIIFLFVAMDPTVVGYFHTLLTEFLAATIAVISCFIALKLYNSPLLSKRFFAFSSFYLVMVPLAWHIKQPYVGAAYFPLLIVSLLIIIRQISWKTLVYSFGFHLTLVAIVLMSTWGWNTFLRAKDNPMRPERQITTALEAQINYQTSISEERPINYLKDKTLEFLAFSNYYIFDFQTNSVIKSPMIGRSNENGAIPHRMFTNPGNSNLHFYSLTYRPYTQHFQTTYDPPSWVNDLFFSRIKLSNSLFTITNLSLPMISIIALILWIKAKTMINTSLVIMSFASLMNMVAHLFLLVPNDRYQFWGYVLNLLIVIIGLVYLSFWLKKYLKKSS
jgi:hypothetical protein